MVMDDNRNPLWLWMTTGLQHGCGRQPDSIMDMDDNQHGTLVTDGSIVVTDDNLTPLWLRMTTGLHHGYG